MTIQQKDVQKEKISAVFGREKYSLLKSAMLDKNLTVTEIAKLLGKRRQKIEACLNDYNKDFTVYEAFIIKDYYFDEYTVDALFRW